TGGGAVTDNGTLGAYTVSTNGLAFTIDNTVVAGAQQFSVKYNGSVLFPCTVASCGGGGGGSGTVTTFSAGNLSPLFTSSVATPTVTPALTFGLSNAAQNSV